MHTFRQIQMQVAESNVHLQEEYASRRLRSN